MWFDVNNKKREKDLPQLKQNLNKLNSQVRNSFLYRLIPYILYLRTQSFKQHQLNINEPQLLQLSNISIINTQRKRCQRLLNKNQQLKQKILMIKASLQQKMAMGQQKSIFHIQGQKIQQNINKSANQLRYKIDILKERIKDRSKNQKPNSQQLQMPTQATLKKESLKTVKDSIFALEKGVEFLFEKIIYLKQDMVQTKAYEQNLRRD